MKRGWLITACVVAGVVGVLGGTGLVAVFSFRGVAPRTELTEAEKSLLVQVDDLVAFGIVPRLGEHREAFKAKRNLDGSLELEYGYEALGGAVRFSLKSEAEVCATEKEAGESFKARLLAYRVGVWMGAHAGNRLADQANLPGVGSENYVGEMRAGKNAAGSIVMARQGRTVFSVLLSGVFIEAPADWAALLGPRLANEGRVACQ